MLGMVIVAIFAIVPFTVLSPFEYPRPSAWESFLSINPRMAVNPVPLVSTAFAKETDDNACREDAPVVSARAAGTDCRLTR